MTAKAALKDPVTEGLRALLGERFSTAERVNHVLPSMPLTTSNLVFV